MNLEKQRQKWARQVKQARTRKKGLSQEKLARAANRSVFYVISVENGRRGTVEGVQLLMEKIASWEHPA